MFEFAWPWVFALLPLPWLMRALLPMADSGEPALKVSFLSELEGLSGRRAKANLPVWRQRAPFLLIWLLLLIAAARPQWLGRATAGGCQWPRPAGGSRRVRL
ncbi:von Willebrand factor, type A, partial [Pseudomonas syringae pv. pisi str. 1704B]